MQSIISAGLPVTAFPKGVTQLTYTIYICWRILGSSVVTIPNVAMRYVSRYLGHDAIRIAILVYCLDLKKEKKLYIFFIVSTPESF